MEEAEIWARGKKLSDGDEQFLRESRVFDKFENEKVLTATQEDNNILTSAKLEAESELNEARVKIDKLTDKEKQVKQRLVETESALNEAKVKIDKLIEEEKQVKQRLADFEQRELSFKMLGVTAAFVGGTAFLSMINSSNKPKNLIDALIEKTTPKNLIDTPIEKTIIMITSKLSVFLLGTLLGVILASSIATIQSPS